MFCSYQKFLSKWNVKAFLKSSPIDLAEKANIIRITEIKKT